MALAGGPKYDLVALEQWHSLLVSLATSLVPASPSHYPYRKHPFVLSIPAHTMPYHTLPYQTIPNRATSLLHHYMLHQYLIVLHSSILKCTSSKPTVPYRTLPYFTVIDCTILHLTKDTKITATQSLILVPMRQILVTGQWSHISAQISFLLNAKLHAGTACISFLRALCLHLKTRKKSFVKH